MQFFQTVTASVLIFCSVYFRLVRVLHRENRYKKNIIFLMKICSKNACLLAVGWYILNHLAREVFNTLLTNVYNLIYPSQGNRLNLNNNR